MQVFGLLLLSVGGGCDGVVGDGSYGCVSCGGSSVEIGGGNLTARLMCKPGCTRLRAPLPKSCSISSLQVDTGTDSREINPVFADRLLLPPFGTRGASLTVRGGC